MTFSAMEYERWFNQLSRYARHLVSTEERKPRRFERGLRPEVGGIVSGLRLPTYGEVVEHAQVVSISLNLETLVQKPQDTSGNKKWELSNKEQKSQPKKK